MICALLALTLSVSDVQVVPLGANAVQGSLTRLDAEQLQLDTPDGPQAFALSELQTVTFAEPGTTARGPIEVTLRGGTVLQAEQFHSDEEGQATVKVAELAPLNLPARLLATLLLKRQQPDSDLARQWNDIVAGQPDTDLIVFRRDDALDQLGGIVRAVGDETLEFEFNGDRLQPRRNRLEGIVYYQAPTELPAAICRLNSRGGSIWMLRDLQLVGDRLQMTTVSGLDVELPVAEVVSLDFGTANIDYLIDLEPESIDWRPYVVVGQVSPLLARHFAPRFESGFSGEPLVLDGRACNKGMAIHSRTEIRYRLREDYESFQAVVGMDRRLFNEGINSAVRLVVQADDGRILWEDEINMADAPRRLNVDITGVRRLIITVDFANDADIADHLILCEARLTK